MMPSCNPPGATRPDIVHLNMTNEDGQVVVTPSNQDRFVLKMEKAVRACQVVQSAEVFEKRFRVMLGRLGEWLSNHRDSAASAWLTMRDGQWSFVVMRKQVAYDGAFEDQLTDLELGIARDSDLEGIHVSTMVLPLMSEECLQSFVDPALAMVFNPLGDRVANR